MQALRSHIALLLLLCLTRTLLPEAWLLTLHAHAHTTIEPAHARAWDCKDKALVGVKHQHCEVEKFYNAAFQAAALVAVPSPRLARRYSAAIVPLAVRAAAGQLVRPLAMRGPPRRA